MNDDDRLKIVEKHLTMLCEHFDSVQIIAVRKANSEGAVQRLAHGQGSWYERYGATREWLLHQEAIGKAEAVDGREDE